MDHEIEIAYQAWINSEAGKAYESAMANYGQAIKSLTEKHEFVAARIALELDPDYIIGLDSRERKAWQALLFKKYTTLRG